MDKKILIRLFLILALVQLVVPLSMIANREMVLKHGRQFKFKVAPVDPYDAFRGRYVAIRVDDITIKGAQGFSYGQKVFAVFEEDEYGLAKLANISVAKPNRRDYVQAKVYNSYNNITTVDLPIDRYYMEETAAPKAEKIYREHTSWGSKKNAYALVKIRDGLVVVEGLFLDDGRRIEDAVREGK